MGNELYLNHLYQEKEFWNRYENLCSVLEHLNGQQDLIQRVRQEVAIPEQARDLTVKALAGDLEQTRKLFLEIFENFITGVQAGLSRVDVEVSITVVSRDMFEVNRCILWVEGQALDIPPEIGQRFGACIMEGGSGTAADAIQRFYEKEESLYDLRLGGIQDRCSLKLMEEIYPARALHVRLRLPAQVLLEHRVIRGA